MNTAFISALVSNPSVFFVKFVGEPLLSVAVAYGVVWLVMRPRDGRKLGKPILWHSIGVALTVIGSALFRVAAVATFAGGSAYELTGTDAGLYGLIVPAAFAALYIAWLKRVIV